MGSISLSDASENNKNRDATLLYLTMPLAYPQWVFSSLQYNVAYNWLADVEINRLKVWNVGQGNYNELMTGDSPYLIYDAGTATFSKGGVAAHKGNLKGELKNGLPLFVVSHWHADHYSLLFALENKDLMRIQYYVFPSYVKNLSVFLFVARLNLIGATVDAKAIEGIVSVGENNGYGHPNDEVMKQIKTYVPKVRMTKDCGDIDMWL